MKRLLARTLFAVAITVTAPVTAQQGEPTYLERAWSHGERIEFSLSWLRMAGGNAVMTIAPADPDHYRITSLGQSNAFFSKIFKVRDEIESVVDRRSLASRRFRKLLQERSRFKEEITEVDPVKGVATRKGKTIEIPPSTLDPLALIFHVRKLYLAPGVKHSASVLADGKFYTVEIEVLGRETIVTDAGSFRTVVVEPKMARGGIFKDEENRMMIWYTDDERHIPVRIRSILAHGSITASLRGYSVEGGPENGGARLK